MTSAASAAPNEVSATLLLGLGEGGGYLARVLVEVFRKDGG